MLFDVVCDNHLAIFYPLPYFELEAINSVLSTATDVVPNAQKYLDLTFHWIMLRQVADPDFSQNFITSFDYQIIANSASKLSAILIGDQNNQITYKYPDYAVFVCDDSPHMELSTELMFMGNMIDSDERWEFYKA